MTITLIKLLKKRSNGKYAIEFLSVGFTFINIFDDNKNWQICIGLLFFAITIDNIKGDK